MGDVARPRLAEVLTALTDTLLSLWTSVRDVALSPYGASGINDSHSHIGLFSWTVTDPAEAQERLVSRDLLPEGWCGDVRRGWASDYVMPAGSPFDTLPMLGPNPCTIPDLVALASLGWPAIQRAEELARAACAALREYGCPQPERVVWRVGERGLPDRCVHEEKGGECDGVILYADGSCWWSSEYDEGHEIDAPAARALWDSGLALDAITGDAVRIVVPPVGGAR